MFLFDNTLKKVDICVKEIYFLCEYHSIDWFFKKKFKFNSIYISDSKKNIVVTHFLM